MLAALDSLLEVGFDTADQARRFLSWRDRGAYTPNGEGLFDIGGATSRALARLARGVPAEEAGDDPKALGNGSLMRILSVALADPSATTADLVDRAHRSSRVTHGATECLVACALYVLVVRELVQGESDRRHAFDRALGILRAEYVRTGDGRLSEALDALMAWPSREGRGHVLDSFWSAWDAFAAADDYQSAVVRAVMYGGDTDTTAAITGGLAGLFFGEADIPSAWRSSLRGTDIVGPLVNRLSRRLNGSREPQLPEMDPDYPYSIDDLERIHDWKEWHRIHDEHPGA
jgi:ADP-ribosylglycohydrolase